jgi:hypothetical protein
MAKNDQGRGKELAARPRDLRVQARKTNQRPRPANDRPNEPDDQRTNGLLWLGLTEGRTRDALAERIAQAHLTELPTGANGDRRSELSRRS